MSDHHARKQANPFPFSNYAGPSGSSLNERGSRIAESSSSTSRLAASSSAWRPQSGPRIAHPLRFAKSARKYDAAPSGSSTPVRQDMFPIGHASPALFKTARKSSASVPISNTYSNYSMPNSSHSRPGDMGVVTARKSSHTRPPSYLQSSRDGDATNRRRTLMLPTPNNKPIVTKSRSSLAPRWQLEEDTRRTYRKGAASGMLGMDSGRRQTMSAKSSSTWTAIPRGGYKSTHTKDRPRSYIDRNFRRRIEGDESSDSDMDLAPPPMLLEARTARKQRVLPNPLPRSMESEDEVVYNVSSEDSQGASAPRIPTATRSARKLQSLGSDAYSDELDELDEDNSSSSERNLNSVGPQSETDSDNDEGAGGDDDISLGGVRDQTLDENTPSPALLDAIKPFLPTLTRRHLPFLPRNLRNGFQARCRTGGIMTAPILNERVILQVMYESEADNSSFTITFDAWQCPICRLLGKLETRQMLEKHLDWDHPEIQVISLKVKDEDMWRLILTFPERITPNPEEDQLLSRFAYATSIGQTTSTVLEDPARASSTFTLSTQKDEDDGFSLPGSVGTSPPISRDPTPFPARLKYRSPSPTPLSSIPDTTRGRSITAKSTSGVPQRPRDPRFPTPPPPDDPLGPAARPWSPNFFPAKSEDGSITIHYSCRPGGPKLYDLLGTLPMDQFGVLSWAVLDREAEIIECDDIRDEHKVMHALWARWIILNRKVFISDYFLGTMAFVKEYWKMIHRAAGWSALRYWLLMLLANRYLNGSEVAKVLQSYEKLTGMDSWYE